MTRLQQILVVVLIVQIALAAFVLWPQSAGQAANEPLLPNFAAVDVISMIIENADGNRIVLAKDGEQWVLPEADDYPANGDKILPVLEKLEGIKTNRLVTETENSHQRLKVAADDHNRRLEVTLRDGTRHEVFIGNSAGAAATHIRAGDHPQVYLTGEVQPFELDTRAANWIDPVYYTIPQTASVALTLENENGTFAFERDGETWTMVGLKEGEEFAENNLTTVLNQVSTLQMSKPAGKEEQPGYGLDNPQAVVTITTDDGRQHTLLIGAQNETGQDFLVKSSDSDYYVWIAQFTANDLIGKTRDDFLLPPPTPASEGGTSDTAQ
jgi:hypothetical protein